ncbi:MAG: DUF3422 domain-containing protein [Gammaproteobacteria bacterium]|nr:DUF3422 domain-containing protein [Gammaproteobacteria bacterium]
MNNLATKLTRHPLREQLYAEIHARPFPLITGSVDVLHLALLTSQSEAAQQLEMLANLAETSQQPAPAKNANSFYANMPAYELRWEKHQEFCTITLITPGTTDLPFNRDLTGSLDAQWLDVIPGQLLVRLNLRFERSAQQPDSRQITKFFDDSQLYGSSIVDGKASMWSSFRLHHDDAARILVYDQGLSDYQAGRTLQRIIEIETYRILTLLALPYARSLIPKISDTGNALTRLIKKMQIQESQYELDEQELLENLSVHAAKVEDFRASTAHRFAATSAYNQIVLQRLSDLREQSWPGFSSWKKMLERRLVPAVNTCVSIEGQLQNLSEQAERANNLLRTRVDIKIEEQNQSLLQSLNRRSRLQLRLQQTVEGLSVVAISYYVVGLIKAIAEGANKSGLSADPAIVAAIAVLPVLGITSWLVRRIKHTINQDDND